MPSLSCVMIFSSLSVWRGEVMVWGKGSVLSTVHVQGTECPSGERPLVWELLPSECISVAADKSTSLLKCFSRPPGEPVWKNQSMSMELCWSSRVYWCIENAGNSVWQYITLTKSPPIWDWLCINLWKWCGFSVVLSELYWQYIFLVYFSSPSDDLITQQLHTCSSGISAEAQDEDWGSAGASLSSCSAQSGWRRAE